MSNAPDYELIWHKSTYSTGGDNCLEFTRAHPTLIPVRDSKTPQGPKLMFRPMAWAAFVDHLK